MCLAPEPPIYQYRVDNWGANPSTTYGISVTPGASNGEGGWTASGLGTLAEELCGIWVAVHTGSTTGTDKSHLLDIGVDPAAGSAYSAIISNVVCGLSSPVGTGFGQQFWFPIRIPKGATLGVRVQGVQATAGSVRVMIKGYGLPRRPELVWAGQTSQTIGTITNSQGVTFTPGNAADGTWVSLGTTDRELRHIQVAAQISNGTITAQYTYVEIALANTGTPTILARQVLNVSGTAETINAPFGTNLIEGYWHIPSGSTIYVRGRCNAAPTAGYNAVAIGIG
jgi:hypothetical protein